VEREFILACELQRGRMKIQLRTFHTLMIFNFLFFLMGCAPPKNLAVIENHKLIKKGLYEVDTLSHAWVRYHE
jgi:hypothetical protein